MNFPLWLSYILVTIAATIPFYILIRRDGGAKGERFPRHLRNMLFIPGIIALGFRLFLNIGFDDVGIGLGEFPWLLVIAIILPILVEVLLVTVSVLAGLARLDGSVIRIKEGRINVGSGVRLLLGNKPQPWWQFALNLLLTVSVGALVTLPFALGEEFGWRGLLQDPMIARFGPGAGLFFAGLGWAAWYAPLVLMGYKFPESPRLGAFLYMPLGLISIGMVLSFSYWISGSIWVPALMNASIQVSSLLSPAALGRDGETGRIRFVWIWIWAVLAGLCVSIWNSSLYGA